MTLRSLAGLGPREIPSLSQGHQHHSGVQLGTVWSGGRCGLQAGAVWRPVRSGGRFGLQAGVVWRPARSAGEPRTADMVGQKLCGTAALQRAPLQSWEEPWGLRSARETERRGRRNLAV